MSNELVRIDLGSRHLSPDLIRVATSRRIEIDYESRCVFPRLRRSPDKAGSSTATAHWCTPAMVEAILADARVRREQLKGANQAAYTTFINATEFAVKESKKRLDWLSGTDPMPCREDCHCRSVYVIPRQFESVEMPTDLKLPGSPGGPPRRATYRDSEGRLCSVAQAFHLWPNAYQVTITFTDAERRDRQAKDAEKQRQKESGPAYKTAEEFRDSTVRWFSAFAKGSVPYPRQDSTYEYDPAVLSAVTQKIQEAEALLLTGKISTRSAPSKTEIDAPTRRTVLRLVHSAAPGTQS